MWELEENIEDEEGSVNVRPRRRILCSAQERVKCERLEVGRRGAGSGGITKSKKGEDGCSVQDRATEM